MRTIIWGALAVVAVVAGVWWWGRRQVPPAVRAQQAAANEIAALKAALVAKGFDLSGNRYDFNDPNVRAQLARLAAETVVTKLADGRVVRTYPNIQGLYIAPKA